jgi:DNA mismatch endonuclease, patch repair protein
MTAQRPISQSPKRNPQRPSTVATTKRRKPDMSLFRSVNTAPERVVRRILHSLGFRYRIHFKGLPGKPDIVFTRKRKVIFVHGCFWHHHPNCKRAAMPSSNSEYWREKLAYNRRRDANHLVALQEAGWKSLVVWECETRQLQKLAGRLEEFLRDQPVNIQHGTRASA